MRPKAFWQLSRSAKFRLKIFTACSVAGGLFIFAYWKFPQHRDGIKFVGSVCTVAIAVFTAYHVNATFHYSQERQRYESAYKFLDFIGQKDWDLARRARQRCCTTNPAALYDEIENTPELRAQLYRLFGFFEDVSIGIQVGYVDESVVHQGLNEEVVAYWRSFEGVIEVLREKSGSRKYYCEFEKLAVVWGKGELLYRP